MKLNNFKLKNKEVRIEPTNMCNAKCIMCPREKMARPQGVMSMGLYEKIIDQCVEAGAELVSIENFGEALLDPYFINRAKYAKGKGLKVLTITNGSLIHRIGYSDILSYVDIIRISMYATSEKTYNKIHKGLKFKEVKRNVDTLINVRNNSGSKTKIHLYFLLMKENEHELNEWLTEYESIADLVSVWKPHNWGDGRNYRKSNEEKKTCNRPSTGTLQVQWDGKVVPCCFDYDNAKVLGDFNNLNLHEIMNSIDYVELRDIHKSGEFHKAPFCNLCDQLNKRDDVLVYTNNKDVKVGATNTAYFDLIKKDVYPIGTGTVWFGRHFPLDKPYTRPDPKEIEEHLDYLFNHVGNKSLMIDTANSYGGSESRIGSYFKKNPENLDKALIATKWGEVFNRKGGTYLDHSQDNLYTSLNNSLDKIGKVDILYIHKPTVNVLHNTKLKNEIIRLRNNRLFSKIGISFSQENILNYAIDNCLIDWIDIIQIPAYILMKQKRLIEYIVEKDIKIVLNSPIRRGIGLTPKSTYDYLLNNKHLFVVLTGTRNHLKETLDYIK